ncbi:MAG: hypothetical protein V4642_09535 [Bacteroidota bacterium]
MEDRLKILAHKLAENEGLHTSEIIELMDNGLAEPIITHGKQPERPQSNEGTYLGGFKLTETGRKLAAE